MSTLILKELCSSQSQLGIEVQSFGLMAPFIMTFNMDILLSDNVSLKDKYLDFLFCFGYAIKD